MSTQAENQFSVVPTIKAAQRMTLYSAFLCWLILDELFLLALLFRRQSHLAWPVHLPIEPIPKSPK
jgi:hypothetical protein